MSRFIKAGAAGALFLVAVGIGAAITSPTPAAEAATIPSVAATVAPTINPTPEPTEQPTPDPTPEPTPDVSGYLEFSSHALTAIDPILAGLTDLENAATNGNLSRVGTVSVDLWVLFGNEVDWLNKHRPTDDCYRTEYRFWRDAMIQYERSMDLISDGIIYTDPSAISRGTAAMQRGTDLVAKATDAIERSSCGGIAGVPA